jgi:hypothetical protein
MNNKIQPLDIHTTTNINNHGSEKECTLNEKINCNQSQQRGEESIVAYYQNRSPSNNT